MLAQRAALVGLAWVKPIAEVSKRDAHQHGIEGRQRRLIFLNHMPGRAVDKRWSGFNSQTTQQGAEQKGPVARTAFPFLKNCRGRRGMHSLLTAIPDLILNKTHGRQQTRFVRGQPLLPFLDSPCQRRRQGHGHTVPGGSKLGHLLPRGKVTELNLGPWIKPGGSFRVTGARRGRFRAPQVLNLRAQRAHGRRQGGVSRPPVKLLLPRP